MDDIKKFSQGILGALAGQSLTSAGLPGVSDVVNRFAAAGQRDVAGQGAKGVGVIAGQRADDEEKAAEAARQAKISELKRKLDPNNYQKVRKDDGGFAFFDPDGKEIDISTYAKATGQRRYDVLKDSENPIDLQYMDDYERGLKVMSAAQNGDAESLGKYTVNGRKLTTKDNPKDTFSELMKRYPHIYGVGSYQQTLSNRNNPVFRYQGGSGSVSLPGF